MLLLLFVLARTASPLDLAPLAKLWAVSLARPPESRLLSAKLDDASVAIWKWKEATMGDGAGAACTGVERALAERVRAATGGEALVLSTCARLDVYSYAANDSDLAAIVADDIGGRATRWRASRFLAPRYERPAEPALASRCGADAARHVFEVACFAGLERCEFDPLDSHQAHVVATRVKSNGDAIDGVGRLGIRTHAGQADQGGVRRRGAGPGALRAAALGAPTVGARDGQGGAGRAELS